MWQAEPLFDWSGVEYKTWTKIAMVQIKSPDCISDKFDDGIVYEMSMKKAYIHQ